MATTFKSKDEIIAQINFVEYALSNGYKIDKEKSTQNWMRLDNPITKDRILVKAKANTYSNVDNDSDKGDIISFVGNRISGSVSVDKSNEAFYKSLVKLNEFFGNYINQGKSEAILDKDKYLQKKETLHSLQNKEWNHKPIEDYSFLTNERNISLNTLKLPLFEDKLFNTYFRLDNGHIITNVAFGLSSGEELKGLEVRNSKQKSILGDHENAFFTNTKGMNKIDGVFYGESGIDIASYIELLYANPSFDRSKNYCFLSFSGNLYDSKMKNIIEEISKLPLTPDCKFVSLTDNDFDKLESKKPGKNYDVLFTASLINKFITPVEFTSNDTFYNFTFTKKEDLNTENVKSVFEQQANNIDKNFTADNRFGKYVVVKENETSITLNIPKSIDLVQTNFKEFIKELKAERLYIPHKPVHSNDWNEELQRRKGITAEKKKRNCPK
ncbi:hypothetical protein [Flavobacterium sp. CGRL2]